MFRQRHVDVAQVIHNLAVYLLRHTLIEAPVARLHVEDGDFPPLGRYHGHATVRVAVQQHGVRFYLLHEGIRLADDVRNGFRRVTAGRLQEMVWFADTQFFEEYPVQFIIEILAGMHNDVLCVPVQFGHHPAQFYNLRACAHYRHYPKHDCSLFLTVIRSLFRGTSPVSPIPSPRG